MSVSLKTKKKNSEKDDEGLNNLSTHFLLTLSLVAVHLSVSLNSSRTFQDAFSTISCCAKNKTQQRQESVLQEVSTGHTVRGEEEIDKKEIQF